MLSWMKEWKVKSRAVFIVWYCKGNKLGNKRYECMQQTIESSMLAAGISTKIDQQVESEEEDNSDGVSTQSSQDFQMVNSKKSNRRQYQRQSKSDRRGRNTSENIQGGYERARGTPTRVIRSTAKSHAVAGLQQKISRKHQLQENEWPRLRRETLNVNSR